jgi:hypothetical protein
MSRANVTQFGLAQRHATFSWRSRSRRNWSSHREDPAT